MYKEFTQFVCQITEIGDKQTFKRNNKPDFDKRMISLKLHDGQLLFCELRRMHLLDNIEVGDVVIVKVVFAGSEKNGKKYNNIFINEMSKK
jgi:hypothetical protein